MRDSCVVSPPTAEAVAFTAGYVAYKCHHIDPDLGVPLDRASSEAVAAAPSRWIQTINRGRLYVPSVRWMAVVEAFEVNFSQVMGHTSSRQPGIVRSLVDLVLVKHPSWTRWWSGNWCQHVCSSGCGGSTAPGELSGTRGERPRKCESTPWAPTKLL